MVEIKYGAFRLVQSAKQAITLLEITLPDLRSQSVIRTMEMEFLDVVQRVQGKRVVMDFSCVRIMPSAFLGLLLKLTADLAAKKVKVHACCMAPNILRVFNLINQDQIIPVFPTRKEAMEDKSWGESSWWPFR